MIRRYIVRGACGAVLLGLLAGCGQRASDFNREGNDLYSQRRYGEALSRYQEASRLAPERAEPPANAGNTRYQLQDYLGAVDDQQHALTLAPAEIQAPIHYNLGNAYFRLREFEQAIESYKQALRLDPDDVAAKWNLELAQRMLEEQRQQQARNSSQPRNRPGDQSQPNEDNEQNEPQPGGSQAPEQPPEPAPPSMSRGEAESQLDRLRRREQRRSDEIYRDYAVGGEGEDVEGSPGESRRGW